jgi:hypothetical protein
MIFCTLAACFIAANLGWIPDGRFKMPASFRLGSEQSPLGPPGHMVIREALMVAPPAQQQPNRNLAGTVPQKERRTQPKNPRPRQSL